VLNGGGRAPDEHARSEDEPHRQDAQRDVQQGEAGNQSAAGDPELPDDEIARFDRVSPIAVPSIPHAMLPSVSADHASVRGHLTMRFRGPKGQARRYCPFHIWAIIAIPATT
jgi:hypothetical protein